MIIILLKRLNVNVLQSFLSPNPTIIALLFEILILRVYTYLNFNIVLTFSYIPVPPLWVKHQYLYLTLVYLFFFHRDPLNHLNTTVYQWFFRY